jgi:glycosyltransferase XagB
MTDNEVPEPEAPVPLSRHRQRKRMLDDEIDDREAPVRLPRHRQRKRTLGDEIDDGEAPVHLLRHRQRPARAMPSSRRATPHLAVLGRLDLDARTTATPWQRAVCVAVLAVLALAVGGSAAGYRIGLMAVVAVISALYFVDLVFAACLVTGSASRRDTFTRQESTGLPSWPTFTVLCPMYKETAVLPQFVKAIGALDYPRHALQVLLLLEEDDTETIAFAESMGLPFWFEIIVVPDSQPKTKPKACNYGLQMARGQYIVIFDAEDVPEPDQLKKAAMAFACLPGNVACLQALLNFYNPRQNVLTRLFTAEYSLWFDLMLAGLQHVNGPIPLGGTSNHFRTEVLRGLGGWDPYNVTEDADVGIRLYKQGFRTGMLDSTTYEEANPNVRNWIRQRSRWIKGYMQTLLVHTRGGWDLRRTRDKHFFTFLLVIGGKVIVNFINPFLWAATIGYFVFRSSIGRSIEAVYPAPVFYVAVVTLLLGNMLYLFMFLLGSAYRNNHDLIKYGLLAPFYWLLMSIAACKALWQLIHSPHYWEKTQHGLHLKDKTDNAAVETVTSRQDLEGELIR